MLSDFLAIDKDGESPVAGVAATPQEEDPRAITFCTRGRPSEVGTFNQPQCLLIMNPKYLLHHMPRLILAASVFASAATGRPPVD